MNHLEGVQVGEIIRCGRRLGMGTDLHKVSRLTKTQVICEDGSAFMLSSGVKVGTSSKWETRYGHKATQKEIREIVLANRIRKAQGGLQKLLVTEQNIDAVEALFVVEVDK